ncbi:MAG: Ada metal-binding domain-containing protein [bacterium]
MRQTKGFLALLMLLCLLGATIALAVEGKYVGSSKSHIYHYPDCPWALKIKPENLIHFQSVKEAQEKGYRPCKVCQPPAQD